MASFYSNSHEGRQLRLDVWQDGGNCRWTLYSSGGAVDYYTVYNLYISINGTVVYNPGTVSWSAKKFPAATGSTSGSVWIGNGADAKTVKFNIKKNKIFVFRKDNEERIYSIRTECSSRKHDL